jgi:UDP-N-acetylglucosamine 2-epimerase (non-hydrolysing)/GDP/UDP-N,N'-diacetylbacillosamine 2-epimerase (hydrolysing)
VDVGPRQEGRERAKNTLSVPHDLSDIRSAIKTCLEDPEFQQQAEECENPYDYRGAGCRIVDRLFEININEKTIRKNLTYKH